MHDDETDPETAGAPLRMLGVKGRPGRFSVVNLDPPSIDQATEILRGIATKYEDHHRVRIAEGAIVSAVVLAKRYLSDRALPDTAVDLLDETSAMRTRW